VRKIHEAKTRSLKRKTTNFDWNLRYKYSIQSLNGESEALRMGTKKRKVAKSADKQPKETPVKTDPPPL
jgi:DNA-directed RNA polymerase delta subunit